jgi:hypothetical protein
MTQLVRTLVGLAFLALLVWCSFNVKMGERTFADHADRIGRTPEAKELLDGARATVNPVVEGATERMLGEYVEAPTTATPATPAAPAAKPDKPGPIKVERKRGRVRAAEGTTLASSDGKTKLPGR